MHEYAVVDELISALVPQLAEHPGAVKTVYLRKGELRILSDRALENAFEILARGTRLDGARLVVERVEAIVRCGSCSYRGGARYFEDAGGHFSVPVLTCPECGADVDIEAGRELYVDRVSLSDGAPEPDHDG